MSIWVNASQLSESFSSEIFGVMLIRRITIASTSYLYVVNVMKFGKVTTFNKKITRGK